MATEAISEHLISKNFLHGGASPQTHLVLNPCLLCTSDIDVTPLHKILATGLVKLFVQFPGCTKRSELVDHLYLTKFFVFLVNQHWKIAKPQSFPWSCLPAVHISGCQCPPFWSEGLRHWGTLYLLLAAYFCCPHIFAARCLYLLKFSMHYPLVVPCPVLDPLILFSQQLRVVLILYLPSFLLR